jgi:hypothetical protein
MRRQAEPAPAEAPPAIAPALRLAPTEASRRWAKALRQRCSNSASRSRRARGPRRAAEPPIDPGPHEPGPVSYPAPVPPRRHRGLRRPEPPPLTAAGAALTAPGREAGHAAASHAVLARSAIAPYDRRIVDRPRLKFLSRQIDDARGDPECAGSSRSGGRCGGERRRT